jgi:hypothetical protein
MNPELHHRWNAERDPDRGAHREGEPILKETVAQNKVTLKQSKPR